MISQILKTSLDLLSLPGSSNDLFLTVIASPIMQLGNYYCSGDKPFFWSGSTNSQSRQARKREPVRKAMNYSAILKRKFPEDFDKKKKASVLGKRIPAAPLSSKVIKATQAQYHAKMSASSNKKRDMKDQRKEAADLKAAASAAAAVKRRRHLEPAVLDSSFFKSGRGDELASKELHDRCTESTHSEVDSEAPSRLASRILKKLGKQGYYHEVVISDDED
mmetsp:Transcript_32977/g.50450  ORF Transcript_32977/g.50450 Transcript_32977/m.50450 type:complete len:220 (-) Transcript_32977:82-741(-)